MNEPPNLTTVLAAQEGLLTRAQALTCLTKPAVDHRLGRVWKVILPGVYSTGAGPLSERQRMRAALLWAGDDAQLDDLTALGIYRCRYLPADPRVFVVVPATRQRQSREFVVVRRTVYPPRAVASHLKMPLVPIARGLADFALRHDREREVRAVLLAAVQRRQVTVAELNAELPTAPSRGRRRFMRVLEEIGTGVRSAPEGDVRVLVERSRLLPTPLYNCLLKLPSGRRVSPDLLIEDAALIHETNGREPHEDEDRFESMQERHDSLTAAGFTVLHNSPRMIARSGTRIVREMETCYQRDAGKGLPPGVIMLRRGAT